MQLFNVGGGLYSCRGSYLKQGSQGPRVGTSQSTLTKDEIKNLHGKVNVSPFRRGYQMKTSHPSVWMLSSVMENEMGKGAGRRPTLKRSKTTRVIKCHSTTKPGVNYKIKLS